MKVTEFKEYNNKVYIGVTPVKILKDENGVPVVNPNRATMAKYFENVDAEGEEFEYIKEMVLGGTFDSLGGAPLITAKEEEDALGEIGDAIVDKKVTRATIRLICKTYREVETIEKGKSIIKKEEIMFPLSFMFFNHPYIDGENSKHQVFDTYGNQIWTNKEFKSVAKRGEMPIDIFGDDYTFCMAKSEGELSSLPRPASQLGYGEFIGFLYAYGAFSHKKDALLEEGDINLEEIFKGNVTSVKKSIKLIEEVRTKEGKLCAVNMLFTGNVKNSEARQGYYKVFSPANITKDKELTKKFPAITNSIVKGRKAKNGVAKYSVENTGTIVSKEFAKLPTYGLKELNDTTLNNFIVNTTGSVPVKQELESGVADTEIGEINDDNF